MTDLELSFTRELRDYGVGFVLALVLTATAFAVVAWSGWSADWKLVAISACAVVQVLVHLRFFLHIDLRRSHRDDLQLILFSAVLMVLMVGGSLWILYNQAQRMM